MEYAVVRIGGKQYKVSKGDVLDVDKQSVEKNGSVKFDDVLLWVSGGKVKVGKPKLGNVKVSAKVLEEMKGKKIRVAKFKSKVRYRKVIGFRPFLTRLQILEIESGSKNSVGKLAQESSKKNKTSKQVQSKRS